MSQKSHAADSHAILIELMEVDRGGAGYLSPADMSSLLEHQLRTPLSLESDELAHGIEGTVDAAAIAAAATLTFGDVVRDSKAGDPLLRLVKQYAKRQLTVGGGLPEPVARFFYVAAVLRARAVGDTTVSTLGDGSLDAEARRILTAPWLPEGAKDILRSGLAG